ncbi:septum formation family protein [Nocardioides sp.]|uniref:septum formation family protein n=1 Tax=Nocardioides sp. TaxID=35761 RepID=UPI003783B3D1
MRRPLLAVAAALVLGVSLAAGPAEAGDDPSTAGAPSVGDCYDLTMTQAYEHAAPEPTVACSRRHTLSVVAVGTIPASYDWSTVDWDHFPRPLGRAITRVCEPATVRLLGNVVQRARTLYQDWWFVPSEAEIADGARWFSCEVGLTTTDALLALPAGQPTKITKRIPASIGYCAYQAKGGYPTVACSHPHQWRATFTKLVRLEPTDQNARKAANSTCPRPMRSRNWLYSIDPTSPQAFVLRCLDQTRH